MGWAVYALLGLLAGVLPRVVLGQGTADASLLLSSLGAGGELGDRVRNLLFWAGLLVLLALLAFITNPTDAAFRSFLTELSFRRHLRDLHRPAAPEGDDGFSQPPGQLKGASSSSSSLPLTSGSSSDAAHAAGSSSSTGPSSAAASHAAPSPAPFRFTNRVSISLRTPPYAFHSFGLFSIVAVPADGSSTAPPPSSSSTASAAHTSAGAAASGGGGGRKWLAEPGEADALLAGVWFLGAFGRWWLMGEFRGRADDKALGLKDAPVPAPKVGVKDVKALDGSEEAVAAVLHKKGLDSELPPPYSHSPPPSPRQAQARLQRSRPRSRRPSLDDSAASSTTDPPTLKHDVPTPPAVDPPSSGDHHAPPPPSVPLDPPPPLPSLPSIDPAVLAAHPPLGDLHQALAASQASTAELLGQLSQSSAASAASHASLQATIEELRARKAQEDADRLEVKARTKTLEEGKRQAEAAKREADKKHRLAETLRDAVLARIGELTREMDDARARMAAHRADVAASHAAVAAREAEVKEAGAGRRKKLALTEVRVGEMLHDVKELEGLVRYEEDSLEHAKHDAVFQIEEARKLMASYSTYGGTAGQFRPRTVESDLYTAHSQPPSNIVNASLPGPASSIFDLPIQQLPLSLLQRRRQPNDPPLPPSSSLHGSGGGGHANPAGGHRFGPGDRSSSSSHLNDVFGFEDFGPGVPPRSLNRYSTASRESLQAAVAASSSSSSSSNPSATNAGQQPYLAARSNLALAQLAAGEDSSEDDLLGSPNVMSASFTDLLPRGLFQSLSADGLLSPDPDRSGSAHRPHFDFHDHDGEAADEAGDEAETEVGEPTLSDSVLPASPRSVFSNDPRSLLLEGPEGEDSTGPHHSVSQSSIFGHSTSNSSTSSSATAAAAAAAAHSALSDLSPNSMPFVPSLHGHPSVGGGVASARASSESLVAPPALGGGGGGGGPNSYGASPGGGAGSRFFSSIRAFAPSAAERQALTRALRQNNGSNRSLDTASAGADVKHPPPSPPAQMYANGGARLSQQRIASPFGTPHGSSSDLNREYLAAAAWDAPARPSLDETRTRTKSFSRFFGLGSSFSRKDKDDGSASLLSTSPSASAAGTAADAPASSSAPSATADGSSGSTEVSNGLIPSNWAPSWSKRASASAAAPPVTPTKAGGADGDKAAKGESALVEDDD